MPKLGLEFEIGLLFQMELQVELKLAVALRPGSPHQGWGYLL
jgi:hypothetical protein